MTWRRRALLAVAAALCLALVGAWWWRSDGQVARRAHDAALDRWESTQPTAYSFDYAYCGGMCARCLVHVTVRDGEVADVATREGECTVSRDYAPTIEEVFATEASARSGAHVASSEITYDPTWGFPASVVVRCDDGWSDCGTSLSVTRFHVEP